MHEGIDQTNEEPLERIEDANEEPLERNKDIQKKLYELSTL